ncbi:hypothetical protein LTR72_005284 [Exophiala xenobiotica]|nr:hypothetical protein LTR41_004856 [Exophiala xenobiotica]KAK5223898.1 hypothetical protein LTR72_005284 [Exophiala xenobiotica]KAK5278500.1 hypothetical protein LTR40_009067 [Exophiala xenobiotica]KAK5289298.1 hypothetical protein LTR14_007549 [Exophiala xenobiotica]KAK5323371.1 hypothetical protein LTR93_005424 [Exophiala xenobiotica]
MTNVTQVHSADDAVAGMNKLKLSHPEELGNMEKIQNALQEREKNVGASVVSVALAQVKLTWYLQDEAASLQVAVGLEGLGPERQRTEAALIQMRDIIRNSQVPGLLSTEQKQKDLEKWEKLGQEVEKLLVNLEEALTLLKANQDRQKQQLYEPVEQLTRTLSSW